MHELSRSKNEATAKAMPMSAPLSDLHRAARDLAVAGIPIFPCVEGGKAPATKNGFKDATTDLEQIDRWWKANPNYNIGLPPDRVDWSIADLDPPLGHKTWATLVAKHGTPPDTYEVRTPRGGRHLYFKGSLPPSASKIGPNVDTRGRNSYVLAPPSRTADGEYEVVKDVEVAPLPQWVSDLAGRTREKAKSAGVEQDLPGNIARATLFIENLVKRGDVAVEGQGGDNRTLEVAFRCRDLGLSEERTFDLMWSRFNPHCRPKWSYDGLQQKVSNAYAYGKNEPGAYALPAPDAIWPALDKLGADTARGAGNPVALFRDLLKRTTKPVREVIADLVERGTVTFLAGTGGSNKSRTALAWGLCVDAGVRIYDRAVEQCRFIYLSYEDHADEVARRAQAITRKLNLPSDGTAEYWDLSGRDAPLATIYETSEYKLGEAWRELGDHLKSTDGHKFIVVDGTYNALRFVGSAKINEGAVMVGISLLQRFCDETNSTMVALWHPSQAGQERGDASGWSVAWHNAPRARLSITPVKDTDDTFELKVEKRNHGAKGKPITLYWSDGVLLPRGQTDTAEQNARFTEACVRVALLAAEQGLPIQGQKKLSKWMSDDIERDVGYRPTERVVKETLATAMREGKLRYLKGTNRRMAGYYPPDQTKAEQLAVQAKTMAVHHG